MGQGHRQGLPKGQHVKAAFHPPPPPDKSDANPFVHTQRKKDRGDTVDTHTLFLFLFLFARCRFWLEVLFKGQLISQVFVLPQILLEPLVCRPYGLGRPELVLHGPRDVDLEDAAEEFLCWVGGWVDEVFFFLVLCCCVSSFCAVLCRGTFTLEHVVLVFGVGGVGGVDGWMNE